MKKRSKHPRGDVDAIRYPAYREGRDALIASFGRRGKPTKVEAIELDAAWGIIAQKRR
jgi:hypothetical protein